MGRDLFTPERFEQDIYCHTIYGVCEMLPIFGPNKLLGDGQGGCAFGAGEQAPNTFSHGRRRTASVKRCGPIWGGNATHQGLPLTTCGAGSRCGWRLHMHQLRVSYPLWGTCQAVWDPTYSPTGPNQLHLGGTTIAKGCGRRGCPPGCCDCVRSSH